MDPVDQLTRGLATWGPSLLGLLTFLETSSVLGLFVPAGVCFLLACFLTTQGTMALGAVVGWALLGALLGDSAGYVVGRWRGGPEEEQRGLVAWATQRAGPERLAMLNRAPLTSVSLARVVSFARTLAPLVAGAGRMSYGRYLAYDLIGIAAWAATYVTVGVLAGESWQRVSGMVGAVWVALFVIAGGWVAWKARRRGRTYLSVALTGNAASGKSTVADLWRGWGLPVVDADDLARAAVEPGTPGLAAVVQAFGPGVLTADGHLDRAAVRQRVFADPDERRRLETILHPRIAELREAWVRDRAEEGHSVIVSEIPLLFEAGLEEGFDRVVLVHVPRDVSLDRLVRLRGLDVETAQRVLDAQEPSTDKRERSDMVIDNTASPEALEAAARRAYEELTGAALPAGGAGS